MKKIPKFKNEDEEREFWATHDSTDYFDMSTAIRVKFPPKIATQAISVRLSQWMIEDLKQLASGMDVGYQTLMKVYLAERIDIEKAKAAKKKPKRKGK